MKIKEITKVLEKWAPPSYQESYDNSGLIVGDPQTICTGCLITLDTIESVVEEAIEKKCNLIISHHPIIFSGLKKLNGKNYVERTVLKAIKNDIAIYAIHTNLDNIHTGVNKKISDLIGLQNTKILSPKKGTLKKLVTFIPLSSKEKVLNKLFDAGAGRIGNYEECSYSSDGHGTFKPVGSANPSVGTKNERANVEEARIEIMFPSHLTARIVATLQDSHPYEEVAYYLTDLQNVNQEVGAGMVGELPKEISPNDFLQIVKNNLMVGCVKHTDFHIDKISKVAVCGGSGSFLLNAAISSGADLFITSDFKYHEFFDADNRIIIADIGHYESEAFTKELIFSFLKENLTNIALLLSSINTNPINYL